MAGAERATSKLPVIQRRPQKRAAPDSPTEAPVRTPGLQPAEAVRGTAPGRPAAALWAPPVVPLAEGSRRSSRRWPGAPPFGEDASDRPYEPTPHIGSPRHPREGSPSTPPPPARGQGGT